MVKRGSIARSSSAKADYRAPLGNRIVVKTFAPGSLSPYQLRFWEAIVKQGLKAYVIAGQICIRDQVV